MDSALRGKSTQDQKEIKASQKHLFPLEVVHLMNSNKGTADLNFVAEASNGKEYAVKTIHDNNGYIPATELFSYELAAVLGVATPNYDILKMRDESLVFGSMWEGGLLTIKDRNDVIKVLSGEPKINGMKIFFSKVYALDIFLNNIDRHFGNYIFRDSYSGMIALAYDFSRAWYAFNPYGLECLNDDQKTTACHELIRHFNLFDKEVARFTLDEIDRINDQVIESMLFSIPEDWMNQSVKDDFLEWWKGEDRRRRIVTLKSEIK